MTADPRAALEVFTAALERHLEACSTRRGDDDPAVVAAYDALADAFEDYDEALLNAFNEMTPLEVYADDEDDDEPPHGGEEYDFSDDD